MNKLLIAILGSLLLTGAAQADHHKGDRFGGKFKQKFINELQLAEEQKQPVADIMEEQREKGRAIMQPAFEEVKPQMEALHEETRQRLAAVLTEDQLQKFDELSSKRKQRMERMRERLFGR